MSLHNEIMNIPCPYQENMNDRQKIAHKLGHRDALHMAAELANKQDTLVEELLEALELWKRAQEYTMKYNHLPEARDDIAQAWQDAEELRDKAIAKAKGE